MACRFALVSCNILPLVYHQPAARHGAGRRDGASTWIADYDGGLKVDPIMPEKAEIEKGW